MFSLRGSRCNCGSEALAHGEVGEAGTTPLLLRGTPAPGIGTIMAAAQICLADHIDQVIMDRHGERGHEGGLHKEFVDEALLIMKAFDVLDEGGKGHSVHVPGQQTLPFS